jgi:hypothetical protein
VRSRVFSSTRTAARNFDRLPGIGDPSLQGVYLLLHARIAARAIAATAAVFIITQVLRCRPVGGLMSRRLWLWIIFDGFRMLFGSVDRRPNARAAKLYSSGSEMRVSIFTCGPARLKIGSQKA